MLAERWASTGGCPGGPDRHRVRTQDRHPLERAAHRDGLRFGTDLPAPTAGVAAGGRLGALHQRLLERLAATDGIDWSRAVIDARSFAARKGGACTGPNPTDRGRPGTKHHVLADRNGLPLTVALSAANVHDSRFLDTMLDAVRSVHSGRPGGPRRRPVKLHADKGYEFPRCPRSCRQRGVQARIARRGIEPSERLGRYRCVVERTSAWLAQFKRLLVRFEQSSEMHLALLTLAAALILERTLHRLGNGLLMQRRAPNSPRIDPAALLRGAWAPIASFCMTAWLSCCARCMPTMRTENRCRAQAGANRKSAGRPGRAM